MTKRKEKLRAGIAILEGMRDAFRQEADFCRKENDDCAQILDSKVESIERAIEKHRVQILDRIKETS